MDFGDIGGNLPLLVAIIGIILLQFFLRRRRRPEITRNEIVQSLLSEVKLNQTLVETFSLREKPKPIINIINVKLIGKTVISAINMYEIPGIIE